MKLLPCFPFAFRSALLLLLALPAAEAAPVNRYWTNGTPGSPASGIWAPSANGGTNAWSNVSGNNNPTGSWLENDFAVFQRSAVMGIGSSDYTTSPGAAFTVNAGSLTVDPGSTLTLNTPVQATGIKLLTVAGASSGHVIIGGTNFGTDGRLRVNLAASFNGLIETGATSGSNNHNLLVLTSTSSGGSNLRVQLNGGVLGLDEALVGNSVTIGELSGAAGGFVSVTLGTPTGIRTLVVNQAINNTVFGGEFRDGLNAGVIPNGTLSNGRYLALQKSGGATLTLTGAGLYAGTTTISGGTLQFGKQVALYNNQSGNWAGYWNANKLIVNSGATAAFNVGGTGEFTSGNLDTLKALGTATGGFQSGSFLGIDTTNATLGTFTYASSIANPNGGLNELGLRKLGTQTLVLSGSSSYTGATKIEGGVLEVTALADGGSNSNIGASGNAASNLVLNGGTLSYKGVAVSTDRLFSVGGSGGTLEASGSGALNFTNTGSLGFNGQTGARTLTLQGSNLGDNTLAAVIGDNSGATSLTKTGAGRWILRGANTYTGATLVSAGTLVIDGNQSTATGAVTVVGGATLGGSGTIGGATTISGHHSPGNSPGVQNFVSNLSYTDGSTVTWELIDNTEAGRGTNFDGINVGGALTITGTSTIDLAFNVGSDVVWADAFWDTDRSWLFYDVTGATTGAFTLGAISVDSLGQTLSASRGSFSLRVFANDVYVDYTAIPIPEPSATLLLTGGLMAVLLFRRRRSNHGLDGSPKWMEGRVPPRPLS